MPRLHPPSVKIEERDELMSDGDDDPLSDEDDVGFRIRNALDPPRTGVMTAADLHCGFFLPSFLAVVWILNTYIHGAALIHQGRSLYDRSIIICVLTGTCRRPD